MSVPGLIFKRSYKTRIHPQRYLLTIQLANGSLIQTLTTRIPPAPHSSLFQVTAIDSTNHPSWNPEVNEKAMLDAKGVISQFRKRYGDLDFE